MMTLKNFNRQFFKRDRRWAEFDWRWSCWRWWRWSRRTDGSGSLKWACGQVCRMEHDSSISIPVVHWPAPSSCCWNCRLSVQKVCWCLWEVQKTSLKNSSRGTKLGVCLSTSAYAAWLFLLVCRVWVWVWVCVRTSMYILYCTYYSMYSTINK